MTYKPSGPRRPKSTAAESASPLAAVSQLLAEKAKYEKWLAELEAKRDSTPAKAFEKVLRDYSGRLEGVVEKLNRHQSALQEHVSELEAKLERLSESEDEVTVSRAEAELRSQVGELSESEWDAVSKKAERDLAKIKQDKAVTESELEQIRDILAGASGDGGEQEDDEETEEEPREAERGQGGAGLGTVESSGSPDAVAAASSSVPADEGVDELEFLKSVVGTPPKPEPGVAKAAPAASPKKPTPAKPQPSQQQPPPPAAKKPVESLVEQPKEAEPLVSKSDTSLASRVTGSDAIVIKPAEGSVAQTKTLKCAECGALNYPSEWYCERCGAELTNV